jgi:hypothetical protein
MPLRRRRCAEKERNKAIEAGASHDPQGPPMGGMKRIQTRKQIITQITPPKRIKRRTAQIPAKAHSAALARSHRRVESDERIKRESIMAWIVGAIQNISLEEGTSGLLHRGGFVGRATSHRNGTHAESNGVGSPRFHPAAISDGSRKTCTKSLFSIDINDGSAPGRSLTSTSSCSGI